MLVIIDMFGLTIEFVERLWLETLNNYNSLAKLHTLQIAVAHIMFSQFVLSSPVVAW
jgi:hypothetical protein